MSGCNCFANNMYLLFIYFWVVGGVSCSIFKELPIWLKGNLPLTIRLNIIIKNLSYISISQNFGAAVPISFPWAPLCQQYLLYQR